MGKKRVSALGSTDEEQKKAKHAVQLEQKRLREGLGKKAAKVETPEPEIIQEAAAVEEPEKTTRKTHIRSKSYHTAKAKIDVEKSYPARDALVLLRTVSLTKFDPTVELHLNLAEKGVTLSVELPHPTGKTKRYAIADDKTMAKIEAGQIDFDILVASPDQMPKLVKFAKTLGPRGLMPNPKNGTVVPDPESAVKKMASSAVTVLKTEKDAPLIHTTVGKLSSKDSVLLANIEKILSSTAKITKAVLKSTMSPGIKIQL